MATYTEQLHLDMPPPGWLHVNGVSLSTDVHQQSTYTSDNQTKHVISPPMPFTTTNEKQYQKFENSDMPKKLFIDRQIQKAKSLPGLIKGTALSHHSAPYVNTIGSSQDDPLPINDNDSSRTQRTNEIRRPRVSFSEFNKVQFFEDSNDNLQQSTNHHHHPPRHRSSKKSTAGVNNNHVSPPSIQHSQTLYTPYQPLSRQQPIGHELYIRKQQLNPSPRAHSSRTTHLPDIVNQSVSTDNFNQDKYILQREKSFFQFPEPTVEIPITSSAEMSRENTRAGGTRPTVPDNYDQYDSNGMITTFNSSSLSSSLASRQRPSLRTISLRQQFTTPLKTKPIQFSNNNQINNNRRSASLKQMGIRNQSADDDRDDISNQALENRPVTGISNPSKHLKRNYIIHFNPRNPFNGHSTYDSNETNRYSTKLNIHESPTSSQERFQNVLKIGRPPYITSIQNSPADSILQPTTNQMNGSRSSRNTSSHEYHLPSNTIFV